MPKYTLNKVTEISIPIINASQTTTQASSSQQYTINTKITKSILDLKKIIALQNNYDINRIQICNSEQICNDNDVIPTDSLLSINLLDLCTIKNINVQFIKTYIQLHKSTIKDIKLQIQKQINIPINKQIITDVSGIELSNNDIVQQQEYNLQTLNTKLEIPTHPQRYKVYNVLRKQLVSKNFEIETNDKIAANLERGIFNTIIKSNQSNLWTTTFNYLYVNRAVIVKRHLNDYTLSLIKNKINPCHETCILSRILNKINPNSELQTCPYKNYPTDKMEFLIADYDVDHLNIFNFEKRILKLQEINKHSKNRVDEIRQINLDEIPDGASQCRRCKSWKTEYYELQTRKADEKITQFFTCLACGFKWRE